MSFGFEFALALAIVYGTSYTLKFLERYEIPVLVVEILAGVIFGPLLGILPVHAASLEFFTTLAAFGLLLIMFDAGLELNPELLKDNPKTVGVLGVCTFVVPFLAGVGLAFALGLSTFAAFLVGVTVSTTSLGLVYPLVEDFGLLDTERGQLILSVAVLNDILSVAALAYGLALTSTGSLAVNVALVTVALLVFFALFPLDLAARFRGWFSEDIIGNPVKASIFLAVLFAVLAEFLGIHAILGAFFAGVFVAEVTRDGHAMERSIQPVLDMAAPIFFFYVGMQFNVSAFLSAGPILVGAVILVGLGTKIVGAVVGGALVDLDGWTTRLLASAMPGRLSISVAAAEVGRARGIIGSPLYESFIILSTVSVFVASLLFRRYALDGEPAPNAPADVD